MRWRQCQIEIIPTGEILLDESAKHGWGKPIFSTMLSPYSESVVQYEHTSAYSNTIILITCAYPP